MNILLLSFIFNFSYSQVITINQGKVRGKTKTDRKDGIYYSFTSIPYAKPPIGNLRFLPPQPAGKFEGILDATREAPPCYQRDPATWNDTQPHGKEYCLYINVFTPNLPMPQKKKTLIPVMVWIYGGGFTTGFSQTTLYGPNFILPENIIMVSFNYRLGLLGLLSQKRGYSHVPGNAVLKDQLLALKWVQENIAYFGGDPNQVTIAGESAGAVSVHLHVLSSSSTNYFQQAIMESASVLNPWAIGDVGTAEQLAEYLGIPIDDEAEMIHRLQQLSANDILDAQDSMFTYIQTNTTNILAPVVEEIGPTAFLTQDPSDLIKDGSYNKVPMLLRYNTREGMYLLANKSLPFPTNFKELIPHNLRANKSDSELEEIVTKIEQFFFKNDPSLLEQVDIHFQLYSDLWFVVGIFKFLDYHVKLSPYPTYFYRFSVESKLNVYKNMYNFANYSGAAHGDELAYLFDCYFTPEFEDQSKESLSIDRMVKLWANFVKYGNPTPSDNNDVLNIDWKPLDDVNTYFLDIGNELTNGIFPDRQRMNFWRGLYQKYDATQEPPPCYQRDPTIWNGTLGQEDCLYINVFTPNLPTRKKRKTLIPVMVWIHVGGFIMGSSQTTLYGPNFILPENIVMVSFNYRLGLLGLLSQKGEHSSVPGNAALKDQLLALKWIQENIAYFGGDPYKVTIAGHSAGAVSVHLHVLSPRSKNYFQQAIMESASVLNPWAIGDVGTAEQLAEYLNIPIDDEAEMIHRLQQLPVCDILNAQDKIFTYFKINSTNILAPVVEQNGPTAFFTEKPMDCLTEGDYNQIPMLLGYNSREGMYPLAYKPLPYPTNFKELLPHNLTVNKTDFEVEDIAAIIEQFYFKNDPSLLEQVDIHFQLYSDLGFILGIFQFLNYHVNFSLYPTYFYRFSVESKLHVYKSMYNFDNYSGAAHGDELAYLFDCSFTPEFEEQSKESLCIDRMVKLWANFVKYGNPTPPDNNDVVLNIKWRPVDNVYTQFLDIGNELTNGIFPDKQRMNFWRRLYQKYNS